MHNQPKIEAFWYDYIQTLPNDVEVPPEMPEAWGFGDSPEMAEELGHLVLEGIKTATASAVWEYEVNNEPFPQVGDLSIILDGQGEPLCIIETVEVMVRPYNEVDSQFAYDEGEGDRSLAYWQKAHFNFFTGFLPKIGLQFSKTMPLVLERFRVIYPAQT